MATRFGVSGIIFLVVTLWLLSACSTGGPEAAARKGFEEWAGSSNIAYRNASFKVTSTQEVYATVVVSAEFKPAGFAEWVEQQAEVRLAKQGDQWRPPTSFAFALSPRAMSTAEAARNASATAEAAISRATEVARDQLRQVTATAEVAQMQATATANAVRSQATATAQAEVARETARAAATAVAVGTMQAQIAQATRVAEATQQAVAWATEVAQRTVAVGKQLSVQEAEDDTSGLRSYLANVRFIVEGVERAGERSVIWHLSVWNNNSTGELELRDAGLLGKVSYIVSSNGTRFDAAKWDLFKILPGEKKAILIGFNAPGRAGESYKLFSTTLVGCPNCFPGHADRNYRSKVTWLPVEATLR